MLSHSSSSKSFKMVKQYILGPSSPLQVLPSLPSEYPIKQEHKKLPSVSLQFWLQAPSASHSLMSVSSTNIRSISVWLQYNTIFTCARYVIVV